MSVQTEPYTPLISVPWIKWVDRTEVPAFVVGIVVLLAFLPFYDFAGMAPSLPLQGAAFPPAFALGLMFLLQLTRGARNDLGSLIIAGKIDTGFLEQLAPSKRWAIAELMLGLGIGIERVYSQIFFDQGRNYDPAGLLDAGVVAVIISIVGYTIVQVHLLAFCFRQVVVFRRVALSFQVDLLTPELNNTVSNPLIRFIVVGLVAMSFGLLVYEMIPYASLQARLLRGSFFAGLIWLVLIVVSFLPLLFLKSRIAVAKAIEINAIRRALAGDLSGVAHCQFGERLREFSPADLMYYEDRIKSIWEWPFEVHVRRLVIFGLLPPLTWVMAAAVEMIFEGMIAS